MMEVSAKDRGGVKVNPVNRQGAQSLLHKSCDEETT